MKKVFFVDTNILLSDPEALFAFEENDVVLPLIVIEELDRHKDRQDEVGRNARETVRKIASLTKVHKNLNLGIPLGNKGGTLRILSAGDFGALEANLGLPIELSSEKISGGKVMSGDNSIISLCRGYIAARPEETVILVSKDTLLRIKCNVLGIECEDYRRLQATSSVSKLYSGVKTVEIDFDVDQAYKEKEIELTDEELDMADLFPNQFVILTNKQDGRTALARFISRSMPLYIIEDEMKAGKLLAKNKEQKFALDLLSDPEIKLVTLAGMAGTGKTLLSIASGLEQTLEKKRYKSLVVIRPIQPLGKDVGFLPGPQPLDAKVLTPSGWTTMGQLTVGAEVVGRDGQATKVLGIFPKGKKNVYKISTNDELSTEACEDHLWLTQTWEEKKRGKIGQVKTTKDIARSLTVIKSGKIKLNHYLPRNEAVEFASKSLPLPPYTLGVLLGDGHIGSHISFASIDQEIVEKVRNELFDLGCKVSKSGTTIGYNISRFDNREGNKPGKPVFVYNSTTKETKKYKSVMSASQALRTHKATIGDRCKRRVSVGELEFSFGEKENVWNNPVKEICSKMNLLGTHSWDKFIPEVYLNSSIKQRLDLLRGLMDTDGTSKVNGEVSFTTTSKKLSDGVQELVRSLGGRAVVGEPRNRIEKKNLICDREVCSKRASYEFTISMPKHLNPFHILRKAKNHNCSYIWDSRISSIEFVGQKEVQCILVENPEHLYITDDYIITHNTLAEKMEPWIAPIKDNLRFLLSNSGKRSKGVEEALEMYFEDGIIEIEAMTFIRGRSISDAFIVIDEAQNLNVHELKTIVTRVGEGTKIVLTGDIEQIDNSYVDSLSNGLTVAIEKFKDQPIAGHVTLTVGERSELASLAARVLG